MSVQNNILLTHTPATAQQAFVVFSPLLILQFWHVSPCNLNFHLINPNLQVEDSRVAVEQLQKLAEEMDTKGVKCSPKERKDIVIKSKKILFKLGVKIGHDTAVEVKMLLILSKFL